MAYRIWVIISVLALFFCVDRTARAATCPCSIWPATSQPALADAGPDSAVELGVTFHSDANGFIAGIRFYKSSANTGTHVGNLWSSSGVLLATATFSGESASGWQQVNFSTPVAITANTNYVASYHANVGHYSDDDNFFATSGVDNSPLHATVNGSAGINGRYTYGSTSSFPTSTYLSGNYWVDVVFTSASNTTTAPAITSQPANQSVTNGQTATFSVAASGTAPFAYQWRKNGVNIAAANSSTYTTPATTATDSGAQFSVVVSNSAGSATSVNAVLTVAAITTAPTITSQPANQSVTNGQTATFSVAASGTAPLAYQWRKNGVNIAAANSSTYMTPPTTATDSGAQFSVVVSNSAGSATSVNAVLTVAAITTAPTITSQPANQSVTNGQTATFSVAASGTAPLAYQWRKNGVNIAGANSSTYTTPPTTATDSGAQFSVVISNSAGSATSGNAVLTVATVSTSCPCSIWKGTDVPGKADGGPDSPVELGLTFRSDSNGYITGVRFYKSTANTGTHVGNLWSSSGTLLATATFSAESASGWQQVNFASPVAVTANTTYVASYHVNAGHYAYDSNFFAAAGVDNAPLHAPLNGNGNLNGRYTYGSGSSFPNQSGSSTNYWVDVVFATSLNTTSTAPVITSQPVGSTVLAGQTATFSVAASGTAPLTYQWRKNGANISGANSSTYTTPATVSTDSGSQYSVVVGNSAGSVTSASATLTVSATTRLLTANPTSLSFGSVSVSLNKVLTATFTNTGNSTVTISGVSMSGAGLSVSGVSTGQMIGPSQSATATIVFLPAITGSVNGSLTVSSNATNSPSTVALSGAGVNLVTHSITLGWTASVSSVAGYNVYSGVVSGGPYAKLTSSPVSAVTYKDSSVQSGKTYYYVVTAVNSSGAESGYSSQATAAIP